MECGTPASVPPSSSPVPLTMAATGRSPPDLPVVDDYTTQKHTLMYRDDSSIGMQNNGGSESDVKMHMVQVVPETPLQTPQGTEHHLPSRLVGFGAALLYGSCSSSMAFANKGLLSSYHFNFQVTLMALQMTFTLVVLEALRFSSILHIPRYTISQGASFALPSFLYAVNSVLGLLALTGMNIPMYTLTKRCTPAVCLFLRPILLAYSKPPTIGIKCSVAMVILGCVFATYGDLTFDVMAYTYGTLSVLIQGLYLILIQRDTQTNISTSHSLYLNCYNTLPFLVLYAGLSGELEEAVQFPDLTDPSFLCLLLLVVSMGCLLNYSLFLCTSLNSALTTTIVGGMKGVVQTVIGVFTFGGIDFNAFNIFGLSVNAVGGLLYVFFTVKQID